MFYSKIRIWSHRETEKNWKNSRKRGKDLKNIKFRSVRIFVFFVHSSNQRQLILWGQLDPNYETCNYPNEAARKIVKSENLHFRLMMYINGLEFLPKLVKNMKSLGTLTWNCWNQPRNFWNHHRSWVITLVLVLGGGM